MSVHIAPRKEKFYTYVFIGCVTIAIRLGNTLYVWFSILKKCISDLTVI